MSRVLTVGHTTRLAISQGRCTALLHRRQPSWTEGARITIARRWHDDPDTGGQRQDEHLQIVIQTVAQITLAEFTRADAKAHGLLRPLDICRVYLDANDHGWRARHGHALDDHIPSEVVAQAWERWQGELAWLTTLQAYQTHRPRLLAANSQYGYVDNAAQALSDAGEAPPEEWQRECSTQARMRDLLERTAGRKAAAGKVADVRTLLTKQRANTHLTAADRRTLRKLDHDLSQHQAFLESDA